MLFHKMLAHSHVVHPASRSRKYPNKLIYQPQMTLREHVRIFEIIQPMSNHFTDLGGGSAQHTVSATQQKVQ